MTPVAVPKDPYQLGIQAGRRQGEARIVALEAQIAGLKDPATVWANILRGEIVLPDHLKNAEARVHALESRNESLESHVRRLEEAASLALGHASKGEFETADDVLTRAKEAKP